MADANCHDRNAGGRTSELTSELVKTCQKLIGVETCMHLTCTGMPKEKVDTDLRVSYSQTISFCLLIAIIFACWLSSGKVTHVMFLRVLQELRTVYFVPLVPVTTTLRHSVHDSEDLASGVTREVATFKSPLVRCIRDLQTSHDKCDS